MACTLTVACNFGMHMITSKHTQCTSDACHELALGLLHYMCDVQVQQTYMTMKCIGFAAGQLLPTDLYIQLIDNMNTLVSLQIGLVTFQSCTRPSIYIQGTYIIICHTRIYPRITDKSTASNMVYGLQLCSQWHLRFVS